MKITEILEGRKHKFPKVNADEELYSYLKSLSQTELNNTYVHMSTIDKIGIKPTGGSLDQGNIAGLYAYTAKDWMMYKTSGKDDDSGLPYGDTYPFMFSFNLSTPAVNIKDLSSDNIIDYFNDNLNLIAKKFPNIDSEKVPIDNILNTAKYLASTNKKNDAWQINHALRSLGINAIQGIGYLIKEEVVVLDISFIKNIKKYIRAFHQPPNHNPNRKSNPNATALHPDALYPELTSGTPPVAKSISKWVKYASDLAKNGKEVPNRAAGEKLLFSYTGTGGVKSAIPGLDDYNHEYPSDTIKSYKTNVLDKLNLNWSSPQLKQIADKM